MCCIFTTKKSSCPRTGQLSYNWDATPHLTEDVEPESRVSHWDLKERVILILGTLCTGVAQVSAV